MEENHVLKVALEYAALGLHVFPCTVDKRPLTKWVKGEPGQVATTDPEVIRWWWGERFPDALVGIATGPSGLLVVDVDPKNGGDLADIEIFYEPLPKTLTATTVSGGAHLYYRATPEQGSRNSCSRLARGIDTRGRGGFVVAPPAPGRCFIDSAVPIAPAPEWLLRALNEPRGRAGCAPGEPRAATAGRFSPEDLEDALQRLDPADYPTNAEWEPLLMSCHDAAGGNPDAREAFVLWSTQDPDFSDHEDEIRKRWNSLAPGEVGNITEALLIGHVLKADPTWKPPGERAVDVFGPVAAPTSAPYLDRHRDGRPKSTLRNALAAVRALDLEPAYNELEERVVLLAKRLPWDHACAGRTWDDHVLRVVRELLILQFRLELSRENLDEAVETVALERRYNPVVDYLDGLKWDGEPRIDRWLEHYAGAPDSPFARAAGRLFLVGAVARAHVPGIKFDTALVLEGPQGTGKSSLVRVLGGEWTLEGLPPSEIRGKDVLATLLGAWIVELDELEAVRRSDIASLKAFLSALVARARMPYDRKARDYPRRCAFLGTTNQAAYLRDGTGNRRFWPVRTGRIDLNGLRRDRDQLWAEAVAAWKANPTPEALVLPPGLHVAAAAAQEERREEDPWEGPIRDYLDACAEREPRRIVTISELLGRALRKSDDSQTKYDAARVREIVERLGGWQHPGPWWDPAAGKNVRGFRMDPLLT
jgi:predicted P-loop ATPase